MFNLSFPELPRFRPLVYKPGDCVELCNGKIGTIQVIDWGSERTGYVDGLDRAIVYGDNLSFIAHVTIDEIAGVAPALEVAS